MTYPLISEYVEAIKSPEDNFDKLSHLRPVLDDDGNPYMSSGNFAVVFKMTDGEKFYALKCFIKDKENRAESYEVVSKVFKDIDHKFIVSFNYYDKELFVDSKQGDISEFPVLLMDWVDGTTLDLFVRSNINDSLLMYVISCKFMQMATWLLEQPFSHGDLKPDNIIVDKDFNLKLVDYDSVYAHYTINHYFYESKVLEKGSPSYRHSARLYSKGSKNLSNDRFPIAVIALSLYLLSINPLLLSNNEGLVFSEENHIDISNSNTLDIVKPYLIDSDVSLLFALYLQALSDYNCSLNFFSILKNLSNITRVSSWDLRNKQIEKIKTNEYTYEIIYSHDYRKLISVESHRKMSLSVKNGVMIICDGSIKSSYGIANLTLPNSVKFLGDWIDFHHIDNINCSSNAFVLRDNCLMSKDFTRLIYRKQNINNVFQIPTEVKSLDYYSLFPPCTWLGDMAPYVLKVDHKLIFNIECPCIICAVDKQIEEDLRKQGVNNAIYIGDIMIDDYGVIYSKDKKLLLCFPKELNLVNYHILEGCETIVANAFVGLIDPDDDGYIFIHGNALKTLTFPQTLKEIQDSSFLGCNKLEALFCKSLHSKQIIIDELNKYTDKVHKSSWIRNHIINMLKLKL